MKINIIGGGTWGTTLACLLDENNSINIWVRSSDKALSLNSSRKHPHLPNLIIPENINFIHHPDQLGVSDLTIIATPSHCINDVIKSLNISDTKYLIASKGFDLNTNNFITDLLHDNFNIDLNDIAVLSGPNHAEEIINKKASASVIASKNLNFAKELQSLFSSDVFRVYTSSDIIGVQLGGAVKNIIAIASGLCVGLKLGDNTQAALVSRGMNEILSLKSKYSFDSKTLYGLSGLGDLIATCYSEYSRNRKLGILLAQGHTLNESQQLIGMVSEGVNACRILHDIINDTEINMPICEEVYKILFDNCNPEDSLRKLMNRALKIES